jgi:hypothetical protein
MSTRSAILEKTENGYRGIYCHWDGYLENNGRILATNYTDAAKVHSLIDLGSISSLGKNVAPTRKHSFDAPQKGVTVAYMRDRGETDQEPIVSETIEDVASKIGHNGYVYVFENNEWTCNGTSIMDLGKPLKKLGKVQ